MSVWRRTGLRTRLALALALVAVVSVAITTVLASRGLERNVNRYAQERLRTAADHLGDLAEEFYGRDGRWTARSGYELRHAAEVGDYTLEFFEGDQFPPGAPGTVSVVVPVEIGGKVVGRLKVAPEGGSLMTADDRALQRRLDNLHMVAGGLAVALGLIAALLIAPALTRNLKRLTSAARRMHAGDLEVRVPRSGGPEFEELANALNELAATLAREDELRRNAGADVAHELRTPLAGIISRVEAAQDGVIDDSARNIDEIHREAMRLSTLVEDLERLAEADRPGMTIARREVRLDELIRDRVRIHEPEFDAKNLTLEVRTAPATVLGSPDRLAQVVDNLLVNALRYTDQGGVTVTVAADGPTATLTVADTGIGIAPDDLPHVFERFWRADSSRARTTGGAGIGLSIVERLVAAHDGSIEVSSRLGEGSEFVVRLPLFT